MILCLFRCGYEPNYVRLPLYLYTMIFEYLCVLNFGKVYKKKNCTQHKKVVRILLELIIVKDFLKKMLMTDIR